MNVFNTIRERKLLKIFLVFVISTTPLVGTIEAQEKKDTIQQKSEITISRNPAPLKSNETRENVLQKTQERLDMSISILNVVATLMGVLVALITIIVIIAIALGVFEYRQWRKYRQQAKKAADEVKKAAKEVKPIVDRLRKEKEDIENMRKSIGKISIPSEPALLPEELKKKLDEYGEKIKFLEAFGTPLEPEDYCNRGVDFYYKKEYELALKAFDKAIEMKPDYAEAWYNKGITLSKLGRYDEALKAFDKAIEIKPNYAEAWYNKGITLGKLNRYDEALKAFDKAIEIKPDYAEAWYNKARMHSLKENKENALKNLSRAIELDRKYKENAKKDEDFKNLWDDEDFKRVTS